MSSDYEQLNVATSETSSNPFYHRKSHIKFTEIIRSKNKLSKLLAVVFGFVIIIILLVFQLVKDKTLDKIYLDNEKLNEELMSLKAKGQELNDMYSQSNSEKRSLLKQNDDFLYSVQQFTDKNEELERDYVKQKEIIVELKNKLDNINVELTNSLEDNEGKGNRMDIEDEYSEGIKTLREKIQYLQDEIAKIQAKKEE